MRKLITLLIFATFPFWVISQAPENLGIEINSEFAERMPIISPDGKTLFFARKYHPHNFGEDNKDDIWVSNLMPNGKWSKPFNIGAPLNNKEHNFVVASNPSGTVLYLANDYRSMRKDAVSISKKSGRSWSKPKTLFIQDHYNDSPFVGYHVSVDGNFLVMSVQRKEGFGERDLYVSFREGENKFSKPRNLGSKINTPLEESFVFIAADGKTIYFASDGHGGYGGLDIFRSRRLDNSWTKWSPPQNLGKIINTPNHDYNFTIPASGDYAYFSRDDANGMSDLFKIPLPENLRPEPVTLITGRIINGESKKPMDAELQYQAFNKKDKNSRAETAEDGTFKLVVPYGENVGIYAEQEGYFAVSESVELANENLEDLDYTPDNFNQNQEIEKLQLKINKTNQELSDLEKAKKAARQKEKTIKTKSVSAYKDPQLEALKAKFNAHYSNKKDPTPQQAPSSQPTKKAPKEMTELERMKAKFNNAYNQSKEEEDKNIDSRTLLKTKEVPESDNELAAMKRRYNKAYGKEEPNKQNVEKPVENSKIVENEFETLETEVRNELENTLIEEVKIDLQKELLDDVKQELVAELEDSEKDKLENPDLEKQVQKDYEAEIKQELRDKYREEIKQELRDQYREEIKAEIREALIKEIKADLRKELREEVKEELRLEMRYQIKKELEAELRKELEEKLKQQQEDEKTKPTANQPIVKEEPTEPFEPEYKEVEQDIVLVPIKVGQIIPMNNLFFDSNEKTLKDVSFTELERVLAFLNKNSNLIVEVGGHTNGWCSHSFANELSDGRAKVVAEYFIQNGISKNRIQWKGYGKTAPIASNENSAGRKKNQRVELKILEVLE